jgi:hypothetical protein
MVSLAMPLMQMPVFMTFFFTLREGGERFPDCKWAIDFE